MMMSCKDASDLLHAYADNELDAAKSRELEAHLEQCPACERAFAADRAVKSALANSALLRPAPDALRERLLAASAFSDTGHPPQNSRADAAQWRRGAVTSRSGRMFWQVLAVAASIAIIAGLILIVPGTLSRLRGNEVDAQEALASHLRSMQTETHLMDVPSSDQHTVKPWFDGRLDFAPPVHDLADKGFPLAGGRLDFMHDRPVAALVYHRNKHIINLFIWPGESGQSSEEKQGYNLVHWSDVGMTFWAVSDVNSSELTQFANLFRAESDAPAKP
jgi:mycothiol system anti-sigma-R factor